MDSVDVNYHRSRSGSDIDSFLGLCWNSWTILYSRPVHREAIHSSWDSSEADANWCRWQLWQSWLVCSLRAEGLCPRANVEAQLGVDLQRKRGQGAAERSHRPLRQVPPLEIHYSERHADICPFVMTPALPLSGVESVPVYSLNPDITKNLFW